MIKLFDKDAIICPDHNVSYREMLLRISLFGSNFICETEAQACQDASLRHKVIILSENREGFIYAFFSIWLNKCIAVPVEAEIAKEEFVHILSDSCPSYIWTTTQRESFVRDALREAGVQAQILFIDKYERCALPENLSPAEIDYEIENSATIIYTSGTTGSPKGVVLSFKNLLANVRTLIEDVEIFSEQRRAIILLPLHHVFPLQGSMIAPILSGGGVAICPSMAAPDIMKTLSLGEIRVFLGVPRLWKLLHRGIMNKIESKAITRAMYRLCERVNNVKFSRLVFRKVYNMLGGHLEVCPVGGAALDPEIWRGMHTLGIELMEGYGMTECAPVITFNRADDLMAGSAGQALPVCRINIIDGEICVKGDNVMQGYYNKPEETASVFDSEGWLHTGDLGYLDDKGHLFITGKKKEIIVLSNGKNINPAELEVLLEADTTRVKEAAVLEDKDRLIALVCPQAIWAEGKTVREMETELKKELLQRINGAVSSYKNLADVFVYQGELPRTRLDKLQRFKLPQILNLCKSNIVVVEERLAESTSQNKEYQVLKLYLEGELKREVRPEYNLITDLDCDSLALVALEWFISQSFGIEISQEQLHQFSTLRDLADYISRNSTSISSCESLDWKALIEESEQIGLTVPKMSRSGWWIKSISGWLSKAYFSLKLSGEVNIPSKGQFIMVANHQSAIDGLFLMQAMNREQLSQLRILAKEEHVRSPFRRWLAKNHGVIVIKNSNIKESIIQLGRALKSEGNLMIFPEGTRTEDGSILPFRPTFAILSKALAIPILPVCIKGAYEAFPKHRRLPVASKVRVSYLPLISPEDYNNEEELSNAVQSAIGDCYSL